MAAIAIDTPVDAGTGAGTDAGTVEITVDPMVRQLATMAELIDTLAKTSKILTTEMKSLTKDVNKLRLSKTSGKKVKKVQDPDTPRKLGALEKPVPISDELAEFLGITKGELYSRQFITKSINQYVKDNDIQNPENRRYILLEKPAGLKLKALLRDPDQPLTFFNIQRYLKPHYPKPETDGDATDTARSTDSTKKTSAKKTDKATDKTDKATDKTDTSVVEDAAVVDETEAPETKKKVIRKVVKKTSA
jgi:hypothetical protein